MSRRAAASTGIIEARAEVRATPVSKPPIHSYRGTVRIVCCVAVIQVLPEDADSKPALLKMRGKVPVRRICSSAKCTTTAIVSRHCQLVMVTNQLHCQACLQNGD